MKTRVAVLGLFLLILAAGAVGAGEPAEEAVFEVGGMTCGGCAAGLEKMLVKIDGVEEARVSHEEGRAYLRFDPAKLDPEELAQGMREAGLDATYLADGGGPGATAVSTPHECSPGCAHGSAEAAANELGAEEVARVVDFVLERLASRDPDSTGPITRAEIEAATGVSISDAALPAVEARVRAAVLQDPAAVARIAAAGGAEGCATGHCAKYAACSLERNLAGATGDLLDMYRREREEDGRAYTDFPLPDFEAHDLHGNVVRSADLRGQPAVIALLAGHCGHSHDSLPILQEAAGTPGVRIVGILVNSGSVENVNDWLPRTDPRYEVWVYNDPSLGDLLGSHLVPSYFFVDAGGNVVEKLVGFKTRPDILARVEELAGSAEARASTALGAR